MHEITNGSKVIIQNILIQDEVCEIYFDDDGNIEIYVPENDIHTSFYLKPKAITVQYQIGDLPPIVTI